MKLTDSDKEYILKMGHPKSDLKQIEKAIAYTYFEINDKRISLVEVLEIMDRKEFLSGMSRSAFHWTCCRETKDGKFVHFDTSALFE